MKRKSVSIVFALLFTVVLSVLSQTTYPVKTINGKQYYIYNVQSGEGLFAIGRKFNITPAEIVQANPGMENQVKAGLQLLIPVKKELQPATTKSASGSKQQFIEHTVEKKQTLFAICKKYNITPEELQKYNPELEYGLKQGMTLQIPVGQNGTKKELQANATANNQPQTPQQASTKPSAKYITHEVQAQETLYAISRKYNVSVETLISLNPGCDTKLATGTLLKIPAENGVSASQAKNTKSDGTQTAGTSFDINKLFDNTLTSAKKEQKELHIAFLLPFMLEQDKKEAGTERFLEFYSGALLALQQAKAKGISLTIYTYDTDKTEERMNDILQNSELKTVDLIVGPAFSNQIPAISDFAKLNKIHTLIPFSSKVPDIDTNPYLFQFNPGSDVELEHITDLLTGTAKDMNIVFAQLADVSSMDEGKMWVSDLKNALTAANRKFSTLQLNAPTVTEFTKAMKPGVKNLIIFNTDKFSVVVPYLKAIKEIPAEYQPVLYQQYSWTAQSALLPTGIYMSPFMKYMEADKLTRANSLYTYYYGAPGKQTKLRFDLLGYDLTNYFVELISTNGKKFAGKVETFRYNNGVQSLPKFERSSKNGGFINKQLYTTEN